MITLTASEIRHLGVIVRDLGEAAAHTDFRIAVEGNQICVSYRMANEATVHFFDRQGGE
jgi:hypothetical protein